MDVKVGVVVDLGSVAVDVVAVLVAVASVFEGIGVDFVFVFQSDTPLALSS